MDAAGTITCNLSPEAAAEQVRKWIIDGNSAYDLTEAIKAKLPGHDPVALISAAMVGFERAGRFEPAVVRGWCFETYRHLYHRMAEIGDFAGALRAVRSIEELSRRTENVPDADADKQPGPAPGETKPLPAPQRARKKKASKPKRCRPRHRPDPQASQPPPTEQVPQ